MAVRTSHVDSQQSQNGFRATITDTSMQPTVAARWDDANAVDFAEAAGAGAARSPSQRVVCEYCGRRFDESRIGVHKRVCAASLPSFRDSVKALDRFQPTAAEEEAVGMMEAAAAAAEWARTTRRLQSSR